MTELVAVDAVPPGWRQRCDEQHLFFATSEWQGLLEQAFGVRTAVFWDDSRKAGAAATIFRAGPFRIAYLGFPIGGFVGEPEAGAAIGIIKRELRARGVAALRVALSAFGDRVDIEGHAIETPETCIVDLPSWSEAAMSDKQRPNVKKAQQSGLRLARAECDAHAAAAYAMYADTLQRHRGRRRYNRSYFEALVRLAQRHDDLRVCVALAGDDVAGFIAAVRHGDTAYYLHGGMQREHSARRPSALLIHDAIRWAQERGCRRFNLMSSPAGQPSLVRYKESWGGETRSHRSCTLAVGATYWPFRLAERIYGVLR